MQYLKQLIFVLLFIRIDARERNKLLLTVYYESKCPDSKSFILKQLQPTYNLLHSYVRLKMIPFGKAQSLNYGDDGFVCQHGPSECLGNIVQDCALHHMRGRSDVKKLGYVACEMKTEAAARGDFHEFDQEIQDNAQKDLLGTLCSILTEAAPCAHHYNTLAMAHLLYSNGPTYYLDSGYVTK